MTEPELQALIKGISPFLKDQFEQRDAQIHAHRDALKTTVADLKDARQRIADLEDQATRP